MIIYEVVQRYDDGYDHNVATFGFYTTRDKAYELKNKFERLERDRDMGYIVVEHVLDEPTKYAVYHMNGLKEQLMELLKEAEI